MLLKTTFIVLAISIQQDIIWFNIELLLFIFNFVLIATNSLFFKLVTFKNFYNIKGIIIANQRRSDIIKLSQWLIGLDKHDQFFIFSNFFQLIIKSFSPSCENNSQVNLRRCPIFLAVAW